MYLTGLLIAWKGLRWSNAQRHGLSITLEQIDDLIFYCAVGLILGGRVGYMLFYNFDILARDPLALFKVWQGGMSFHGGLLGGIIGLYLYSKKQSFSFILILDCVAPWVPPGLFFGRLGNFINGELFGRVTDVPWAVVFPRGGPEPRHASQIYEAILEGAVLFIILNLMWRSENIRNRPGVLTGVFIAGYAVARGIVEMFRQPDAHLGFLALGGTMGQWLSLPMFLIGAGFIVWGWRRG